ncbi:hypothetical protein R2050_12555, partial [Enterococcus faecalis]|nr:hypothetical protein [Enterococcus faecalis]
SFELFSLIFITSITLLILFFYSILFVLGAWYFFRSCKIPDHFRLMGVLTHVERKWSGILQAEKAFYTKRRGPLS